MSRLRILVLCKRQYTGKDLLDDRYGRLYEIPAALARRGHEVFGIALSYRPRKTGEFTWNDLPGVRWLSCNIGPSSIRHYLRLLETIAKDFRPHLIWACSDTIHAIIGRQLSTKAQIPLVVDLYDNYESFALSRFPGMLQLFRAACRHASALTFVSETLRSYVTERYRISVPCEVVGNGINREIFFPRDPAFSRSRLGLQIDAQLIGTAGAIVTNRGIEDLFEAFILLANNNERLWLTYAGPRDSVPSRYHHSRIIDLGILSHRETAFLFAALDVAVVCNRDSDFGRYCFPQKLFEIIACGTPVVAAKLGDIGQLFKLQPNALYIPGNPKQLAERIQAYLDNTALPPRISVLTWEAAASQVERLFYQTLQVDQ